jgi:hypothetical protein
MDPKPNPLERPERRKHLRTPVSLPATVHVGGRAIAAIAKDISPGGAFLRCELPGQFPRVIATIALPNGRDLGFSARICWRRSDPREPGIGVQFDRFLDALESERLLGKFPGGRGVGGGSDR